MGRIEAIAWDAFKVSDTVERPGSRVRTDAVERVTIGGVVYLKMEASELDDVRWVPPAQLHLWEQAAA